MALGKHTLRRRDEIMGTISGIHVLRHSDRTCFSGHFTPVDVNPRVRRLFEYFHAVLNTTTPCEPPPMPGFIFENWFLEMPDGGRSRVRFPYLNLETGVIYCQLLSGSIGSG